eukprot:4817827-Prymnesium_polylepis.1
MFVLSSLLAPTGQVGRVCTGPRTHGEMLAALRESYGDTSTSPGQWAAQHHNPSAPTNVTAFITLIQLQNVDMRRQLVTIGMCTALALELIRRILSVLLVSHRVSPLTSQRRGAVRLARPAACVRHNRRGCRK